ncbi:efflux RND transporter periplasmic adaptor subunit [Calidifontibacillus erzurumensis]|uniref:Efflux RND transporter periplasmic adaptor subunit n=1 Tax=Calidifontibacillus erzurumensis TaxID=2741433 RepID=A0A8J8GIG4_9BACI|nr:efflux RND transporter periplasmic adaptor subunit [Calidifontibacillus erzurumensis]NSL52336.1 efflux RND transporter periplasmic adaptor subunit [Calidifontibacillus erzurumensis]
METHIKWIITAILVLGIGSYFAYSQTKPLHTELLEVKEQTVAQEFKEEGIVTSSLEQPIFSEISGKIVKMHVKEGQKVKKGEVLAEIEAKDLEFQLRQLQAQLESIKGQEKQAYKSPYSAQVKQQQLMIEETKRQLEIGKNNYEKIKSLYDSGAVSKQELDDAENKVKQLENALLQQEQALKLIEEQAEPMPGTSQYYKGLRESVNEQIAHLEYLLSSKKIMAPVDAVIKELSVKEGAMVTPQTPLMTLSDDNNLEVEVYLLTEDVINVKEGMIVELIQKRKNGDYSFKGQVKSIAPAAEEKISALGLTEQKVKVTVVPDQKESPELRPGYALDVVFTTLVQENKLAVPKVVLFPTENGGDAVWVVKNGKAKMQEVKTGMETDELVVIEEGLKAGDLVIKNPQLEGLKVGKAVQQSNK